MRSSLRALLAGVIDYAGLFPPAGLPMEQAIRQYARYRKEAESWMLSRFVCPALRLPELDPFLEALFQPGDPLPLAALGKGVDDIHSFSYTLTPEMEAIVAFRNRHGRRAVVDVFEFRLPGDFPRDREAAGTLFLFMTNLIKSEGEAAMTPFFETRFGPDWRARVTDLIASFPNVQFFGVTNKRKRWPREGYKLRCGGLEAAAFPTPEQVAFTIATCRDAGVPLKFTAGLHHPLRHFDPGMQTHMHGFLNVFGAGVLAHARKLDEEAIQAIIEDEEARHFVFEEDRFRWKDHHATVEEIAVARKYAVISFGSCSFDEPRADLRALGLL